MAHIHNVIDTDKHFIIDAVTMTIQNTSDKVKLSQYNHKSERFTFEIPRYIDGHDMSTCNTVEVHFNNVKSDKTVTSKGVYKVSDLNVADDDENTVIFTWLISRKATLYDGTLNFCIRFACINEDAVVEYARYTDIHKGITISESLFNSENIIEDYSDVLEAWKKELEELAASGGGGGLKEIPDDSITTAKIKDHAVTSQKLANYVISTEKIVDNAITTDKLADRNITNEKIAINTIKYENLMNGAVINEKIKDNAIYGDKIRDGAITPKKLSETYLKDIPVTEADNGKFARVVNGVWAAETVPNAEGATF